MFNATSWKFGGGIMRAVRGIRAAAGLIACALAGSSALAQPLIPQSAAVTTQVPGTPGDGVFIEVYNGIGGGREPRPTDLTGRTPTGTTLSPRIDFPSPGSTISVGNSFTTFFSNTCNPPDVIRAAPATNFILRHTFLLRVTQDLDTNPATPEINLQLGVSSDDGFYLTVGGVLLGTAGDRGFSYSGMPVRFEGPGLYPVSLLFAANAVGASGLEFLWITSRSGGANLIVPQADMYLTANTCSRVVNFDTLSANTQLTDQYRSDGAIFRTLSGDPRVTNAFPSDFVPVSAPNVLGDPASAPAATGQVEVTFVLPGTSSRAVVDYVSLFVIDAETTGAVVEAFGSDGISLFRGEYRAGGATQEQVGIARTGIAKVIVTLGSGADTSAIDNFCFAEPYRQPVDLVARGIALPSNAALGTAFTAQYEASNIGGTETNAAWIDRAYLSTDAVLDGSDVAIGSESINTVLAASGAYIRDISCLVPLNGTINPGTYYVLVRVDDNNAQLELNNDNNTANLGSVVLSYPTLPDLQVSSVSVPTRAYFGENAQVSGVIRNGGAGATWATYSDAIYLSTDTQLDGGDLLLYSQGRSAVLAPGASYSQTAVSNIPAGLGLPEGIYYLIARTDINNTQPETDNDNNITSSPGVELVYRRYPDLVPSNVTVTPSVTVGALAQVSFAVTNNGQFAAENAWIDRAYLSLDGILDGSDIAINPVHSRGAVLAVNDSYNGSVTFTAPDAPGTYRILVRADDANAVNENTNENNNVAVSAGTVIIEPTPRADLVVASVNGPATSLAGETISIEYHVNNGGNLAASPDWQDAIYLSTDAVLDASDALLRLSPANALPFAPGAMYTRTRSVTIPTTYLQEADVYVIVKCDNAGVVTEVNRTNNIRSTAAIRVSPVPAPNLTAAVVSGPSSGTFGQNIPVQWSVDNIGNRAANGTWRDQVVLSVDGTFSPDDTPIGSVLVDGVSPFLPESAPYQRSGSYLLPLTAASQSGQYYVIVRTDINGAVTEGNESDNDAAHGPFTVDLPPLPNLVATVSGVPASAAPGGTVTINWNVSNTGAADLPAAPASVLAIYAAPSGQAGAARTALANITLDSVIVAGGSASGSVQVPVADLRTDSFVIGACADSSLTVIETSDADNCGSVSSSITYIRPDLTVASGAVPSSAQAERTATVSFTVRNDGGASAIPFWSDSVYLSTNAAGTNGLQVATQARSVRLDANQIYNVSLEVRIPDDLAGDYYFVIETDVGNRVLESSGNGETNNRWVASTPTRITQPDRPNLVVASVAPVSSGLAGTPADVSYMISNTGLAPAAMAWFERVYASRDNVLSNEDLQIGSAAALRTLGAGESYVQNITLRYPIPDGQWYLIVQVDPTNVVREIATGGASGENDNTRASDAPFSVVTFTATADASIDVAPAGTPVVISGIATIEGTQDPAPFVPVLVRVVVRGFERTLDATTDSLGRFAATFTPSAVEGGLYNVSAGPSDRVPPASDQFTLLSYRVASAPGARIFPGQSRMATLVLQNQGDVAIDGIVVEAVNPPQGVNVSVEYPAGNIIPGMDTLAVGFNISVASEVSEGIITIPLAVASGTVAPAPTAVLTIDVGADVAVLTVLDSALRPIPGGVLRSDMLLGTQTFVELKVRNDGGAPTGPLTVQVPQVPWLTLVSPASVSSLSPGEVASVVMNLSPPSGFMLGEYPGGIAINALANGVTVPFVFKAVSDRVGDLAVIVTDEFTYYDEANGYPRVRNATVKVFDRDTHALVAQGVTGADGTVTFDSLREAYYDIESSSPTHGTVRDVKLVVGGQVSELVTFIPRRVVTYQWTVTPTEIRDEYRINIQATFETNVPAPQVIIEPGYVDLRNQTLPTVIEYTVRNEGLIAAQNVTVPEGNAGGYSLIPLVSNLGELGGGQRVRVPVLVVPTGRGGNCVNVPIRVDWQLPCGPFLNGYSGTAYVYLGVCQSKPGLPPGPGGGAGPGGGWGPGGGGGPGGSGRTFVSSPSITQPVRCNPCSEKCVRAAISCVLDGDCPKAAWDCGNAIFDFSLGKFGKCIFRGMKCFGKTVPKWLFPPSKLTCICKLVRDCAVRCVEGGPNFPCDPFDLVDRGVDFVRGRDPSDNDLEYNYFRDQYSRTEILIAATWYPFGSEAFAEIAPEEEALFDSWRVILADLCDETSAGAEAITTAERATILAAPRPSNLTDEDVTTFIDRYNRTIAYYAQGIYNLTDVPQGWDTNFIELNIMQGLYDETLRIMEEVEAEGFDGVSEALSYSAEALVADRDQNSSGVCATVRIQIDQTLTLTRSAFNATLEINNGGGASGQPIDNIAVRIYVRDADGRDVTNLFGVRPPVLANLSGVDGTGTLPSGQTGSASWTIIPTDDAAPSGPTTAYVSGEFSYSIGGNTVIEPLFPVEITVLPNPNLQLKYFLEREVYSDDPFTAGIVEPAVPFSLGLLVKNTGAGVARDVRIASSQPQITENSRGLVIGFNIIGTQVGTQQTSPSLNVNLGDIAPFTGTNVARWLLTSTLQGEFTSYSASFEHVDPLNDPRLSLIESVDIFGLRHVVKTDASGDDQLPDFLTNEVPDLQGLPDRLHLSTGSVQPVSVRLDSDVNVTTSSLAATVRLQSVPSGYFYVRIDDPFAGGLRIARVTRSDGKVVDNQWNAWQTSRVKRLVGQPPEPQRYIHIFDEGGTGEYTIEFNPDGVAPTASSWRSVADHTPAMPAVGIELTGGSAVSEPRNNGVSRLIVTFDERIDESTFTPVNVSVQGRHADGSMPNLSGIAVSASLAGDGEYGVIEFTPALPDRAMYCIALNGVKDLAGNFLGRNSRVLVAALKGDANGDLRVNSTDVGGVVSLLGTDPIDPDNRFHVRSDVNNDGRVDVSDRGIVLAARGADLRTVVSPCPLGRDEAPTENEVVIATVPQGIKPLNIKPVLPPPPIMAGPQDVSDLSAGSAAPSTLVAGDVTHVASAILSLNVTDSAIDLATVLDGLGVPTQELTSLPAQGWFMLPVRGELASVGAQSSLAAVLARHSIFVSPMTQTDDQDVSTFVVNGLLVRFSDNIPKAWAERVLLQEVSGRVTADFAATPGLYLIEGEFAGFADVAAAAKRLGARGDVMFAVPDVMTLRRGGSAVAAASVQDRLVTLLTSAANRAEDRPIAMIGDFATASSAVAFAPATVPSADSAVGNDAMELLAATYGRQLHLCNVWTLPDARGMRAAQATSVLRAIAFAHEQGAVISDCGLPVHSGKLPQRGTQSSDDDDQNDDEITAVGAAAQR